VVVILELRSDNIKNTKFVKDLPMIDAQFRFNQCNSFREEYIYNTCALSKHMGNMCTRLRNAGKGEALPSFFPPNTHIYLYASTVHMYCIYPAILNRK
jgi:hypothetical protein